MLGRVVHPVRGLGEVLFVRLEDIVHVGLRVPIHQWELGALYLDHDAMALLEGVQHVL